MTGYPRYSLFNQFPGKRFSRFVLWCEQVRACRDSHTDAVGDQVFLECSAEQLADASTTASGLLRYVSVSITPGDNGEEAIILYIRTNARYPKTSLTADIVA